MKTVITLGPKGSYHSIVAKKNYKNCTVVYVNSFNEIITKLFDNKKASALIAVHNSTTGEIKSTKELLNKYQEKIEIITSIPLDIDHSLISLKDSNLLDITTVISHPQALKQCSKFIKKYKLKTMFSTSTTQAVQEIIQLKDPTIAAIAPSHKLTKTKILRKKIQNNSHNVTTFLEIGVKLNFKDASKKLKRLRYNTNRKIL